MAEADARVLEYARTILTLNKRPFREVSRGRDGREHHLCKVVLEDGSLRLMKFARADAITDPNWPERTPASALAAEAYALSLLRGVRVPRHYEILEGDPPAALLEILPGHTPEQKAMAGMLDPALLDRICFEMGEVLGHIHSVKRPPDPGPITDLPRFPSDNPRLLHMDFHLGNIVGTAHLGKGWQPVGVIDWTCVHWGPREADMAEMGVSVFATNLRAMDPFLAGYRRTSGLSLDPKKILDYIARELVRRMDDDPPEEQTIRNLWQARIEQWSAPKPKPKTEG